MATFRTKSGERKRQALPIKEPTRISTPQGSVLALPGDWLILRRNGIYIKCEKSVFFQSYEPADEEAVQLWKQYYGEEQSS